MADYNITGYTVGTIPNNGILATTWTRIPGMSANDYLGLFDASGLYYNYSLIGSTATIGVSYIFMTGVRPSTEYQWRFYDQYANLKAYTDYTFWPVMMDWEKWAQMINLGPAIICTGPAMSHVCGSIANHYSMPLRLY